MIRNSGICNGAEVIGNKWICNGTELTGNSSGQRKSAIVQLKIDMDPRYVRLPIDSRDSLGHQCCLMACVLGQYPSLHGSGKTDNHLATTTALCLPHWWELVNQVGVVALFAWQVLSMASYFRVPVVLLTVIFRDYSQVLPTVKRIGIIPRSEPATEKKLGRNSTQCLNI